MSLTHSITNAMSGLVASSRSAEVVSNNVANVMTEGYARREIDLSARNVGGRGAGVNVNGVSRVVDEALLRDRRLADASVGESSVKAEFFSTLERLIGTPEDAGSLDSRVAALEKSLIEAASRPDSDARLRSVADAATGLTSHLNRMSDGIQQLRMDAEDKISIQVQTVNASLKQIADLNTQIVSATSSKRDTSALLDLRQQEIDRISSIVPLRVVDRDKGQVALFSMNGARLVDGRASVLEFEQTRFITPEMSLDSPLKSILVDGRDEPISGPNSAFAGGSLGALFELRDGLATTAQSQIDAFAADLVGRFERTSVDSTVAAGTSGLFSDDTDLALEPADEVGLAGRITVNERVDPDRGGDLRQLRDGIYGPPRDVGDGAQLQLFADALNLRDTAPPGALPERHTVSGLSGFMLSSAGVSRQSAEAALSGATGQRTTLHQMQMADGVDTDAEMQKLMLIEQAYSANARVLSAVDEMMQTLLRI